MKKYNFSIAVKRFIEGCIEILFQGRLCDLRCNTRHAVHSYTRTLVHRHITLLEKDFPYLL